MFTLFYHVNNCFFYILFLCLSSLFLSLISPFCLWLGNNISTINREEHKYCNIEDVACGYVLLVVKVCLFLFSCAKIFLQVFLFVWRFIFATSWFFLERFYLNILFCVSKANIESSNIAYLFVVKVHLCNFMVFSQEMNSISISARNA